MDLTLTNSGDAPDQRDLVAFRLHRQTYALPIDQIIQIIEMVTIIPIPQVSRSVEGVINVRGATVSVVNLRRHLGMLEIRPHLHTPILLVQTSKQMVGLVVDEVIDVLSLPVEQITRPTDILPEGLGEVPILQGLAHTDNGTMLLLDLEHLFLPNQVHALAQATATLPEHVGTSEKPSVDTQPETVAEEASEEPPAETQPKPARRRRRKESDQETPKEPSTETQPKPARRRRKKDKATSKETPLVEPAPEVET